MIYRQTLLLTFFAIACDSCCISLTALQGLSKGVVELAGENVPAVQVNDLGAATAERIERQDDDIFLLQNSLVEVGTLVQAMDADQNA